MEELVKQYAQPLIIIAIVIALIAIFAILLSTTGAGAIIIEQFKELITNFFNQANDTIK